MTRIRMRNSHCLTYLNGNGDDISMVIESCCMNDVV